jgi:hypothetical protein
MWYSAGGSRTPDEISDAFFHCIVYGAVGDAHRESLVAAGASELLAPSVKGR